MECSESYCQSKCKSMILARLALQRGPVVYCLEGADQKDSAVQSIVTDTSAVIHAVYRPNVLNGITELTFTGLR